MAREQTPDIEQAVRNVLSKVLSEVSEEIGSSEPNGGGNGAGSGMRLRMRGARPGSPKPPGGEPGTPDLPSGVLEAVEDLCGDLSADQASALAQLFEAIANQAEEEAPGEKEGIGARAAGSTCDPAYLWAKAEQHGQKADDYDAAARHEAAQSRPSAKKIAHYKRRASAHQRKAERYRLKTKQCEVAGRSSA